MIITEANAVCNLLARAGTFAGLMKDGWYKSSTELATFPLSVEKLTLKHEEWIGLLRKFGQSYDDKLTAFVEEAEKILNEEQERASRLKTKRVPRWKARAFPGRLTEILATMETIVDAGREALKSRVETCTFLEQNMSYTAIPLPFKRDHRYVPIARSIAEVQTAVEKAEGCRVVIVYGDGGLGKTSLVKYIALHYDKLNRERPQLGEPFSQLFLDGVFYLSCGQGAVSRIKGLERELLESLGYGSEATTDDISEDPEREYYTTPSRDHRNLRRKLASRNALIILDDVWEREVLERLLIPGEAVTYLITSRKRNIWAHPDARRIQLEKPTPEDAKKILAMYTELPENIEEIIDSIINGVGFYPLMLANIGLAMGVTRGNHPDEWRRMAKGWQDELHERDFKYYPVLHGQSYQLSMDETMNLMMESLEEGERSLLLLMSLFGSERVPEVVVKLLRKCMEPGESYFNYRRYRDQLHDKSLLEVYSPHLHGCGPSDPDTEYRQTYLVIHKLRALYIRKSYLEQLRPMAKRALEAASHTNTCSARPWMIGRGLWGAITATSDALWSMVIGGAGPIKCHTRDSIVIGTGGYGEESSTERGMLTGILAAMYIDKTLVDVVQPNAQSVLRAPCSELGIIPRSVRSDVEVVNLVQRAQTKKDSMGWLVELLNPDAEEGWKQEAHQCATKIILKFICQDQLDDVCVAQLVQLNQHTTVVICDTIKEILRQGYWASKFVDRNITFSSVHFETTKSLFDLLYNDDTPVKTLRSVTRALGGSIGTGILSYEDKDTIHDIAKELVKLLDEDTSEIWQYAILEGLFSHQSRECSLMCEIPNFRKRIVKLLLDKITAHQGLDRVLYTIGSLCKMKTVASEIINIPDALDTFWMLIGSNYGRPQTDAFHILGAALQILECLRRSLSEDDSKRVCGNREGLINLIDILTWSEEGGDHTLTHSSRRFQPVSMREDNLDLRYVLHKALLLLRDLAFIKEVRKMILDICPEVPERLHFLERSAITCAASVRDNTTDGHIKWLWYRLAAGVSETRTIFNTALVRSGIADYSPPISTKAFGRVLEGRIDGCLAMGMYKEVLDVARDIRFDMYNNPASERWRPCSLSLREQIMFAKAMVQDYAGALVIANDILLRYRQKGWSLERPYAMRGLLTRLSGGNLAEAIADLDLSLKLWRSNFSLYVRNFYFLHIYYTLKQRGCVKHLMGDDSGAREDAQTAQDLHHRGMVWDNHLYLWDEDYNLRLLQVPVNY